MKIVQKLANKSAFKGKSKIEFNLIIKIISITIILQNEFIYNIKIIILLYSLPKRSLLQNRKKNNI